MSSDLTEAEPAALEPTDFKQPGVGVPDSRGHDALYYVVLFEVPVQRQEPITGKLSHLFREPVHTRRIR